MGYTLQAICRGDGKGYAKVAATGVRAEDLVAVATATNGNDIICSVYPFGFPAEDPEAVRQAGGEPNTDDGSTHFVVAVPLLDGTDLMVRLFRKDQPDTPVFSFPWKPFATKVRSRLGYRFHGEESLQMRGIDQRRLSGEPYVYVTGIFPVSETECSCRFIARFPWREKRAHTVRAFDREANELEVTPLVIEDTEVYTRNDLNIPVHEQLYAIRVRRDQGTLCITVTEDGASYPCGNFTCLLPTNFQGFVNGVLDGTKCAYYDENYAGWFEKRRASSRSGRTDRSSVWSACSSAPRRGSFVQ